MFCWAGMKETPCGSRGLWACASKRALLQDVPTGGVGRQARLIASELLLVLVLLLPAPLLVLLGELAEGAAAAEVQGEALCSAEYLGSCRLPLPWGMLKGCLLFRDIIIILAGGGGPAQPTAETGEEVGS